jgi:hypothetical protein
VEDPDRRLPRDLHIKDAELIVLALRIAHRGSVYRNL